jgi:hypothetical protein
MIVMSSQRNRRQRIARSHVELASLSGKRNVHTCNDNPPQAYSLQTLVIERRARPWPVQAERKTAKSIDWGKERRHGFISRPCASAALAVGGLGFLEAIPTRPTLAKFEKRRSPPRFALTGYAWRSQTQTTSGRRVCGVA